MMCGGHSEPKTDIPEDVASAALALKDEILAKAGSSGAKFDIVSYTSQVVAGTIWMIKIAISEDQHVHARVFKPLPHTKAEPSLQAAGLFACGDALAPLEPSA
jgi:hypothetical protein